MCRRKPCRCAIYRIILRYFYTVLILCGTIGYLLKLRTLEALRVPGFFVATRPASGGPDSGRRRGRRRGHFSRKERTDLTITVHNNDIEKALRDLKRTIQRDGTMKEVKKRRFYEKPSVKKKRKQAEAERRRRKALRNRRPDRG